MGITITCNNHNNIAIHVPINHWLVSKTNKCELITNYIKISTRSSFILSVELTGHVMWVYKQRRESTSVLGYLVYWNGFAGLDRLPLHSLLLLRFSLCWATIGGSTPRRCSRLYRFQSEGQFQGFITILFYFWWSLKRIQFILHFLEITLCDLYRDKV